METIREKMWFWAELLRCHHEIDVWELDGSLELTGTNESVTGMEAVLLRQLRRMDALELLKRTLRPVVWQDEWGLLWAAEMASCEDEAVFVLGPVVTMEADEAKLRDLAGRQALAVPERQRLLQRLRSLPEISSMRLFEYAVTMHYCLTGEKISASQLGQEQMEEAEMERPKGDLQRAWLMEKEYLRAIEEGNLLYFNQKELVARIDQVNVYGAEPLRQMKNTIIVSTALATRAAIRGGMQIETAYGISDYLIREVEQAQNVGQVMEANRKMVSEFVTRVHRIRQEGAVSAPIQRCCDYIELNPEKRFTMQELAEATGYSRVYLGQRFQEEKHCTVKEYIRRVKMRRACDMLEGGRHSVEEIADRLQLASASYLIAQFKKEYGITPKEYQIRAAVKKGD